MTRIVLSSAHFALEEFEGVWIRNEATLLRGSAGFVARGGRSLESEDRAGGRALA